MRGVRSCLASMEHPYRTPAKPVSAPPQEAQESDDGEVHVVVAVTVLVSLAQVLWDVQDGAWKGQTSLAFGTSLVGLALLRPAVVALWARLAQRSRRR